MSQFLRHSGGCHCGKVRFEIETAPEVTVLNCNCSICSMAGFQHLIMPAANFHLLSDENDLALYQFNERIARHYFCCYCGIKSFYIPRSNPDGVSVNFRCISNPGFSQVRYEDFDGQDWEANGASLSHLSKPTS